MTNCVLFVRFVKPKPVVVSEAGAHGSFREAGPTQGEIFWADGFWADEGVLGVKLP